MKAVRAIAGALAMLAWVVLCCTLAATLAGCDNGGASYAGRSQGRRTYDVVETAWYGHSGDLTPINDELNDCERLPLLEIVTPWPLAEYEKPCPANSAACLRWVPLHGRARTLSYPVAYLSPNVSASRWPALVIHELLHAFYMCSFENYDYEHIDPRVWEGTPGDRHPDSVESVSERALYKPGPLIDERE